MRTNGKLQLFLLSTIFFLFGIGGFQVTSLVNNWIFSRVSDVEDTIKPIVKKINPEQLRCMANNIYFEAGAEPFMGKVAVARVVMNRIEHGYAATPCKVIGQASPAKRQVNDEEVKMICQFSWVCEGKSMPNKMTTTYRQAEEIARQVLSENKWSELIPDNVLFFHSNRVNPGWSYRRAFTIGNHIFYSNGNELLKSNEKKL